MWSLLKKNRKECGQFRDWLEESGGSLRDAETMPELLAAAREAQRHHAGTCADCESAARELLMSRAILSESARHAQPGRWFAPRVMAAIAARESQLRRAIDAWTAVPKLAARLTWVAALALLLTSPWLYQKPVSGPVTPVLTDLTGEPSTDIAPLPATDDEVLVSLVEQKQ